MHSVPALVMFLFLSEREAGLRIETISDISFIYQLVYVEEIKKQEEN